MSPKKAPSKRASTGRTTPKKTKPEVTSGAEWARQGREETSGKPLTVPSGKTCLVRRPSGLKFFLDKGMVPNALMPLIQKAVNENVGTTNEAVNQIVADDPSVLAEILEMADRVTVHCVVQPAVAPVPLYSVDADEAWRLPPTPELNGTSIPADQRADDDTLYVDYIDLDDKMFIFNYAVSGVTDVEQFRRESSQGVAPVRPVEAVSQGSV